MNGANPTGPFVSLIKGPTVAAGGMPSAQMYEVVQVGELGLVGEVVRLIGNRATIQVYEDTTMLKPGEPIRRTGQPLACVPQVMRANSAIGTAEKLAELEKRVGEELDVLAKEFSKKAE